MCLWMAGRPREGIIFPGVELQAIVRHLTQALGNSLGNNTKSPQPLSHLSSSELLFKK